MSSSGSIISTLNSGTLSLQNATGNSAKVDSQKTADKTPEAPKTGDSVSTENIDSKASTLSSILDGISNSLQTIENAQGSVSKVLTLIKQGIQIAQTADTKIDPPDIAALANLKAKFNAMLVTLNKTVEDADFKGANLLQGSAIETSFGENARNNIVTEGQDISSEGLGLAEAVFSDKQNIQDTLGQLALAEKQASEFLDKLSEDQNLIQTRQDFTKEALGALEDAGKTIDTDEGANLLALQIGQQLREFNASLASQDQQNLLRLF